MKKIALLFFIATLLTSCNNQKEISVNEEDQKSNTEVSTNMNVNNSSSIISSNWVINSQDIISGSIQSSAVPSMEMAQNSSAQDEFNHLSN